MGYRVELARNAERDLEDLYTWVVNRAPIQGAAWFNGLEHAILALEEMPRRYRLAREPFGANRRVRVLPYANARTYTASSLRLTKPPSQCASCTYATVADACPVLSM